MLDLRTIDPDTLYDIEETASKLFKSTSWLKNHRLRGTGPRYMKGRPVRYRGRDLVVWLESQRVETVAA